MIIASKTGISHDITCQVMTSCLPAMLLNTGNNNHAASKAIRVDTSVTRIDSVRNWAMRCLRAEPNTLRTPTSRARFDDRAVERFMKFTQAIIKINIAMAEKM